MVGSRVNRGAGYGLEIIPVRYIISTPRKSGGMDQEEGGREESESINTINKCLKNEVKNST